MKASLPCAHALGARVQLTAAAAASEHCSSHAVAEAAGGSSVPASAATWDTVQANYNSVQRAIHYGGLASRQPSCATIKQSKVS